MFFFTPCDSRYVLYMGKDKFENEELIKYGLPTDIWFHVDNMSSAHVYLRLPEGQTVDDIPQNVLDDCCQLVKDNSIKGRKEANVSVVYTPWSNLLKKQSMEVGQVGFKKQKAVIQTSVHKENVIVNRLNKTKKEEYPDLIRIKNQYDERQRLKNDHAKREQKKREKDELKEQLKRKELESYTDLMSYDSMSSNRESEMTEEDFEASFM